MSSGPSFRILCDRLGFHQHTGECWSDTIQQILFFADGFKEITQPLFYNITDEEIEEKVDLFIKKYPQIITREDYIEGCIAMRNRFKRHYDYLILLESHPDLTPQEVGEMYRRENSSTLYSEHAVLKRQDSANLGKKSALSFVKTKGATCRESRDVLSNILGIFDIPREGAIFKRVSITKIIEGGEILESGHATAFYKCNARWQYYDDNQGIFPVSDKFMQVYDLFQRGHLSDVKITTEPKGLVLIRFLREKPIMLYIDSLQQGYRWDIVIIFLRMFLLKPYHDLRDVEIYRGEGPDIPIKSVFVGSQSPESTESYWVDLNETLETMLEDYEMPEFLVKYVSTVKMKKQFKKDSQVIIYSLKDSCGKSAYKNLKSVHSYLYFLFSTIFDVKFSITPLDFQTLYYPIFAVFLRERFVFDPSESDTLVISKYFIELCQFLTMADISAYNKRPSALKPIVKVPDTTLCYALLTMDTSHSQIVVKRRESRKKRLRGTQTRRRPVGMR